MSDRILIRMGDGERISMTPDQVKEDLLMGTQDAADGVKGITAKSRIADLLDISINSVNLFKSKLNAPLR